MTPMEKNEISMSLTPTEFVTLVALIEQELTEVHAELRRTEDFEFHEKVHEREALLRVLRDKLKQNGPVPAAAAL